MTKSEYINQYLLINSTKYDNKENLLEEAFASYIKFLLCNKSNILLNTIVTRDEDLLSEEIVDMIVSAKRIYEEDDISLEDILLEEFGLEPDYIFDLLDLIYE